MAMEVCVREGTHAVTEALPNPKPSQERYHANPEYASLYALANSTPTRFDSSTVASMHATRRLMCVESECHNTVWRNEGLGSTHTRYMHNTCT